MSVQMWRHIRTSQYRIVLRKRMFTCFLWEQTWQFDINSVQIFFWVTTAEFLMDINSLLFTDTFTINEGKRGSWQSVKRQRVDKTWWMAEGYPCVMLEGENGTCVMLEGENGMNEGMLPRFLHSWILLMKGYQLPPIHHVWDPGVVMSTSHAFFYSFEARWIRWYLFWGNLIIIATWKGISLNDERV